MTTADLHRAAIRLAINISHGKEHHHGLIKFSERWAKSRYKRLLKFEDVAERILKMRTDQPVKADKIITLMEKYLREIY